MVQGDSYPIKVQIKKGGTIITTDNCAGVKIKLGTVTKTSTDGTITYDSTDQAWVYPMTQIESIALSENAPMGIEIKIGTNVYGSTTKYVKVERGIIKEVWS